LPYCHCLLTLLVRLLLLSNLGGILGEATWASDEAVIKPD
jgi:hypothetical protein